MPSLSFQPIPRCLANFLISSEIKADLNFLYMVPTPGIEPGYAI